jgi:hypothetical protein
VFFVAFPEIFIFYQKYTLIIFPKKPASNPQATLCSPAGRKRLVRFRRQRCARPRL